MPGRIVRAAAWALLTAACRMGAISASATDELLTAMSKYGLRVGLAFQIMDDLLDVTSTPQQLGKATQKDVKKGKNTFPAIVGIKESRAEAKAQVGAAINCLENFRDSGVGLRHLAEFVVARSS